MSTLCVLCGYETFIDVMQILVTPNHYTCKVYKTTKLLAKDNRTHMGRTFHELVVSPLNFRTLCEKNLKNRIPSLWKQSNRVTPCLSAPTDSLM